MVHILLVYGQRVALKHVSKRNLKFKRVAHQGFRRALQAQRQACSPAGARFSHGPNHISGKSMLIQRIGCSVKRIGIIWKISANGEQDWIAAANAVFGILVAVPVHVEVIFILNLPLGNNPPPIGQHGDRTTCCFISKPIRGRCIARLGTGLNHLNTKHKNL